MNGVGRSEAWWKGYPSSLTAATLACALAAWIGFASGRFMGGPPPVMPMTGVAIAVLLLGGKRLWPAIILALCLIFPTAKMSDPLVVRALIIAGIALGAIVGTAVIERIDMLADGRNMWTIIAGALIGSLVMGGIGMAAPWLVDPLAISHWPYVLLDRWLRHVVGALITLPLVLSWASPATERWTMIRIAHLGAILAATVIASGLVFLRPSPGPIAWAAYPPLIWAALVFRVRGVSLAWLVMSVAALLGTANGLGPFAFYASAPSLTLDLFLGTTVVTMLALATLAHERSSEAQLRREASTARDRAEETEARLQLAHQAAGIGVWEVNLAGGFAFHTAESERLFDLDHRDGRPHYADDFGDRMSDEHRLLLHNAIIETEQTQGRCDFVVAVTLRNGATRWLRNVGRFDDKHGYRRVLGMVMDVTTLREGEARLRIANDQLLQVSRLSAMGAMASTLAHELNQPLSAIANFAASCRRLLERVGREANALPLEMLESLANEALRAGKIIRKMRDFTVRGEIVREPCNLARMIEAGCAAVRGRPAAAGVEIVRHLDPEVVEIEVDHVQIEQVIANIVMNAAEATLGCRERRIDISTLRVGDNVVIGVADTGIGLSPQMEANLFEPFRTTKEDGTGLGLSICRTIIEGHGGRLWAEQAPGNGALFKISLPIVSAE